VSRRNVEVEAFHGELSGGNARRREWRKAFKLRASATPLRRIDEPDEIAGATIFLTSQAGSFVTAEAIVFDGGVTI